MPPIEHYRSKEAYRKNLAYRMIHHLPMTASRVCIGTGEHKSCHKVDHRDQSPERRRIDKAARRKYRRRAHARHMARLAGRQIPRRDRARRPQ